MKKHIPTVSIGMPVYNGEKFIREALDSLLAQTFTDFELIISDNASTDDTEQICREFLAKDERIRYIKQITNIGAYANFKFVLDEAVGTFFMWAAYDDIWSKNWLSLLVSSLQHGDAGIYSLACFIQEGKEIRSHKPDSYLKGNYRGFFLAFNYKALLIYGLFRINMLRLAARELLRGECLGMDHVILLKILRYGNLRVIDGAKHSYRVHNDQSTSVPSGFYNKLMYIIGNRLPCKYFFSIQAVPLLHKPIILLLIPVSYGVRACRLFIELLRKFRIMSS